MAKVKTIKIGLTEQQLEKLKPLFDEVEKRPNEGFVLAQVYAAGMMKVGFTTPEEVRNGMEKAIEKKAKRLIDPA